MVSDNAFSSLTHCVTHRAADHLIDNNAVGLGTIVFALRWVLAQDSLRIRDSLSLWNERMASASPSG